MCGIAGIVYRDQHRGVEQPVLQQMSDAIAHRGPDGEGFFKANNVGLVHRRLAIIDLAGGQQPIANEDETVQVVFNGEIYNYPELKQQMLAKGHQFRTNSDTEILVHLYEEFGTDLVKHLRGMFAFALWDTKTRTLMLGRDHLGQKPLYVYQDEEKLVFASELKAILATPNIDRTLSPAAIEDYLTFGVVPGDACIFKRVQKLPAAHWMLIHTGGKPAQRHRYWALNYDQEQQGTDDEWMQQVDASIKESVQKHLLADVPVGAFLSGGLDSSAIVASLADTQSSPIQTYAIGFQEKRFSELPHAEAVAKHFGTTHREQVVTPDAVRDLDELCFYFDEPFADASAIPTMAVARMAAQHVKVCLSGDGGDENFAGYARYSHDLKEASIRQLIPQIVRKNLLNPLGVIWPKADWLPRPLRLKTALQNLAADPAVAYANTISQCRRGMRRTVLNSDFQATLGNHRPEAIVEQHFSAGDRDALSGMLSADVNMLLPDDFLTKVDRASMAYGLEVRPPLIDVPLMELAATMPSSLKVRNGQKKWILKQLFENRLPAELAHRKKQGFELPVDDWLRGPLQEQVQEVVLNQNGALANIIDVGAIQRINNAHQKHTGQHGQLMWSLLVLGRWMESYGTSSPATATAQPSISRSNQLMPGGVS
ncbi:MAG: asparagine synthase (glutamine-hydrolyzing) [Fuerstiella sp.]